MMSLVVERVPKFSGTRPKSDFFWATWTRLFQVGYVPDPTRTRPFETKHKIWSKKCMIPDKIPDYLGTRIRLFGIPILPDPNPTFYYPIYSISNFLLPAPPLDVIEFSIYCCCFLQNPNQTFCWKQFSIKLKILY